MQMQIPGLSARMADTIWDTICYMGAGEEIIRSRDILNTLNKYHGDEAAPKTWECGWDKFNRWARSNLDQFHGPASRLERVGAGRYKLMNGPEL